MRHWYLDGLPFEYTEHCAVCGRPHLSVHHRMRWHPCTYVKNMAHLCCSPKDISWDIHHKKRIVYVMLLQQASSVLGTIFCIRPLAHVKTLQLGMLNVFKTSGSSFTRSSSHWIRPIESAHHRQSDAGIQVVLVSLVSKPKRKRSIGCLHRFQRFPLWSWGCVSKLAMDGIDPWLIGRKFWRKLTKKKTKNNNNNKTKKKNKQK